MGNMAESQENRVMTIEQLADFLQLSLRTAYQLVTEGRLPCARVGKQWRFDREKIIRWINDGAELRDRPPKGRRSDLRILIVDDNPDIVNTIADAIGSELAKALVCKASDGLSALIELGRFHPSVVIADIAIPRVDGLQICNIIKNDPDLSHILFIAISGVPESEIKEQLESANIDLFMRKPFEPEKLVKNIEQLLSKSAAGMIKEKARAVS
jgi:excisionase family DNA binding protein